MRILVLGGDGFCGWPTSLHLSNLGHQVHIVDNFLRRKIDVELGIQSLTPIVALHERLQAWREVTGHHIGSTYLDVADDYDGLLQLIRNFAPDSIVHFAEVRAAPYSMKSSWHKRFTVNHNMSATNNVLAAIVESGLDIHLVHLGTMGVYGYSTSAAIIPEGYLKVNIPTQNGEFITRDILHPAHPGSIYHTTKTMDQMLFYFYNANDGLRITDLHQGIVWGTQTREARLDERLINRFDYDGDYGTVLNRFLVQAAIGYPLTVDGSGGQTRAFIRIQDSVRCIELAVTNPPARRERVRIFNQVTEVHRVRDLAQFVSARCGVPVQYVDNPRNEASENDLNVENRCLLDLGLLPTALQEGLLTELIDIAGRYSDRCDRSRVPCTSRWATESAARRHVERLRYRA